MQVRELAELKTNCRRPRLVWPRLYAFLAWKRMLESLSEPKLGCYKVVLVIRKVWDNAFGRQGLKQSGFVYYAVTRVN